MSAGQSRATYNKGIVTLNAVVARQLDGHRNWKLCAGRNHQTIAAQMRKKAQRAGDECCWGGGGGGFGLISVAQNDLIGGDPDSHGPGSSLRGRLSSAGGSKLSQSSSALQ